MWLKIAFLIVTFLVGYFVGANNPLSSVKKKIADEAKGLLKKIPFIALPLLVLQAHAQDPIPGDHLVSLSEAFAHCAHTVSYWVIMFLPIVVGGPLVWFIHYEGVKNNKDVDNIIKWVVIGLFVIIVAHIFATPCDLAQNTLESWAKQGKWVGY